MQLRWYSIFHFCSVEQQPKPLSKRFSYTLEQKNNAINAIEKALEEKILLVEAISAVSIGEGEKRGNGIKVRTMDKWWRQRNSLRDRFAAEKQKRNRNER